MTAHRYREPVTVRDRAPVAAAATADRGRRPHRHRKVRPGLDLAERLDGEIVNADSMQLYRGMDIGTAKLPVAERRGIPHHLLDVLDVSEIATVAVLSAGRQGLHRGHPGPRAHPDPGRRFRSVHPVRRRRHRFPGNGSGGPGAAAG